MRKPVAAPQHRYIASVSCLPCHAFSSTKHRVDVGQYYKTLLTTVSVRPETTAAYI